MMDAIFGILLAFTAVIFLGILYVIMKLREMEHGARAALQNIQLQLAFVSGRIGLRNQDLQAATERAVNPDAPPLPPPEVLGGMQWNDVEELLDRAERGEIEVEEPERAA